MGTRLKLGSKTQSRLRVLQREHGWGKLVLESQRSFTCRHSVQALVERETEGMVGLQRPNDMGESRLVLGVYNFEELLTR